MMKTYQSSLRFTRTVIYLFRFSRHDHAVKQLLSSLFLIMEFDSFFFPPCIRFSVQKPMNHFVRLPLKSSLSYVSIRFFFASFPPNFVFFLSLNKIYENVELLITTSK